MIIRLSFGPGNVLFSLSQQNENILKRLVFTNKPQDKDCCEAKNCPSLCPVLILFISSYLKKTYQPEEKKC